MVFSEVVERLDVTRARIEASLSEPAVIAVTSARAGDGKELLATALAHSFAGVGYRVLLVGADHYEPFVSGVRSAPKLSERPDYDILAYVKPGGPGEPDLLELTAPGVASSCSKETAASTFARFRAAYRFTIVDTSVLGQSGVAFTFVSASDQVVLAFKQGRSSKPEDRTAIELLKSAEAAVAGTVFMESKAIKSFRNEQRTSFSGRRLTLPSHSDETAKSSSVGVRAG